MVDVASRLQAIEDMMQPLVPLRDQVATIEVTLTEQGQHQQLMNAGLLHAEPTLRNQDNGWPPNGRRRGDDEDDDEGFPTTHKMKSPKYDDMGDPLPWLNRCECYFRMQRTPKNRRVAYASFYLTNDAQLWYHRLELNAGPPLWPRFVQLVNKRFGPPMTGNPIGELALLHRDSSVDDFAKRFMALSCRDTTITEAHQMQLFLTRLEKPLHTDVTLHRQPTLNDIVILARAYEQREMTPPPPSLSMP
jgi:hypothetical protein